MTDTSHHTNQVQRVLVVTLVLNVIVAVVKLAYGYHSHIVSLQADGFHSIFDGLSNIIGLVALGIAKRPPDPEHPYGHRKLEVAASVVIGFMVILGMMEVGRGVYHALDAGTTPTIEPAAYGVVIFAIVTSLFVSWWENRAGNRLGSMLLKSDAAHTLSDSLAGIAVLIGIFLVDQGMAAGDILASIVVMTFIGMTAYRVLRSGMDVLVDTAIVDAQEVKSLVESHDRVLNCHFVRSRGMAGHIFIEFHMSLPPETTLADAGQVMVEVKRSLRETFHGIEDVLIQVEPHEPEHVDDVPARLI